MKMGSRNGVMFGTLALLCCTVAVVPRLPAQTSAPATTTTTRAAATTRRHRTHRRHRTAAVQTLPIEQASPATGQSVQANAATEAQQRAADARLLKQQQAQSDKDAAINDRMVQRAQKRQDAQQDEIRIQDAPGPAQTGVVPPAGTPVQPAQTDQRTPDQRIQDQPSAVPGQNTNPPQR